MRFLMMIAMEVFAVALDMPDVGSHTLLLLVSGVCLLTWVACVALRTQRLPDAGSLFEQIAPFLAVQLVLVYEVAAVANLNRTWLDASRPRPLGQPGRAYEQIRGHLSVAVGCWLIGAAIFPDEPGTGPTLLSDGMGLLMVAAFAGGILVVLALARGARRAIPAGLYGSALGLCRRDPALLMVLNSVPVSGPSGPDPCV